MTLGWRPTAAVLGALAVVFGGGFRAGTARAFVFRVSITNSPISQPIAREFLGLGLEYRTIPSWVGPAHAPVNPVLIQLARNLAPGGSTVLRIGGQSTDRSWWPVPGMQRPSGVTYSLGPEWTAAAARLAHVLGAKLLLGVNLEANRTRLAQVEAAELAKRIGRQNIEAFEIGNEPDLYPKVPWYRRLGRHLLPWYSHAGTPVYSRRSTYGPSAFIEEFARTLRAMPRLPVGGPETSGAPWLDAFGLLVAPRSQVRILTSHAYGLNQCVTDPASSQYPSVPHLLALSASREILTGVGPWVGRVHARGGSYRIDEMGSITCNGRAGVSNTMASALWMMDALFAIAARNIDGVNLHTYPNSVNGLFDFSHSRGRWQGIVHPVYYGAVMFAHAAPPGARLLRIHSGSQARLRAWATVAGDHRVRVLLINDSLHSNVEALVRVPHGFETQAGTVERLTGPSAYAKGGVTLGGRRLRARTSTGILPPPLLGSAKPRKGIYTVTVPAHSAALLTLGRA